jgi:protein CpxP
MNRSKLLTIAVIGLLIINLGTLAFLFSGSISHPVHDHRPPRGEGPKRIIIERLDFDELQQKEYESSIEEHRSETRRLNHLSRKLHNELFSLLKNEGGYQAGADAIIEKIALNQKAIDHLNFNHFQKIRSICKGPQVQKFNELADDLAHLFAPEGPPH